VLGRKLIQIPVYVPEAVQFGASGRGPDQNTTAQQYSKSSRHGSSFGKQGRADSGSYCCLNRKLASSSTTGIVFSPNDFSLLPEWN
jgi:hypothetical protein